MASSSSSAVRKQLTRALSLLTADARAARVPLPAPFQSFPFNEEGDRPPSSTSSSTSSSSSSSDTSLLRATLGDDASDLDASFARLRRLREQLEFLASTPPDVRQSLALWRQLQDDEIQGREERQGALLSSSESLSFERGALLLPSVARPPERLELGGSSSDDEDEEDEGGSEETSPERVSAALDDAALAASDALPPNSNGKESVRGLARLLFDGEAPSSSSHSGYQHLNDNSSSGRLFVVPRLRPAAVEWLYDGLAPLFPGSVLRRGQRLVLSSSSSSSQRQGTGGGGGSVGVGAGAPIALAAVASAIARRLGVWNVPVPAEGAAASRREQGSAPVLSASLSPHLSPSVAARMAARTPAAAPETGSWLLACPLGQWVWDPATGEVVSGSGGQAGRRWPSAGFSAGGGGGGGGSPFSLPPAASDPRVGWASMLRACVVAHTRRGDSDAVAAVLPQLLALDGEAPEWGQVLRASEVLKAGRS